MSYAARASFFGAQLLVLTAGRPFTVFRNIYNKTSAKWPLYGFQDQLSLNASKVLQNAPRWSIPQCL